MLMVNGTSVVIVNLFVLTLGKAQSCDIYVSFILFYVSICLLFSEVLVCVRARAYVRVCVLERH